MSAVRAAKNKQGKVPGSRLGKDIENPTSKEPRFELLVTEGRVRHVCVQFAAVAHRANWYWSTWMAAHGSTKP